MKAVQPPEWLERWPNKQPKAQMTWKLAEQFTETYKQLVSQVKSNQR